MTDIIFGIDKMMVFLLRFIEMSMGKFSLVINNFLMILDIVNLHLCAWINSLKAYWHSSSDEYLSLFMWLYFDCGNIYNLSSIWNFENSKLFK